MTTLEEHIAEHLRESEASGELRAAPSYGRPLDWGDGYEQTPSELRMPFKILKDAGVVPAEVQMLQELARLKRQLAAGAVDAEAAAVLRQRVVELQQHVALRLERLRLSGSL
jgi:hypothetical protein